MVCNIKFLQNPNSDPLERGDVLAQRAAVGVERKSPSTYIFLQDASGTLVLRSGLVVYAKSECRGASEFLEPQVEISATLLVACFWVTPVFWGLSKGTVEYEI